MPVNKRMQFFIQYPDGSYKYGYDTGLGAYEEASSSRSGEVRGVFEYQDPFGRPAKVSYSAGGEGGFVPDDASYGTGSYYFNYHEDNESRSEYVDEERNLRGRYSYVDENGVERTVFYRAGPKIGFVVEDDDSEGMEIGKPVVFYRQENDDFDRRENEPNLNNKIKRHLTPPEGMANSRRRSLLNTLARNHVLPALPGSKGTTLMKKDGSYSFGYEDVDGSRYETADRDLRVEGNYTFTDQRGRQRTVVYKAGPKIGFVAQEVTAGGFLVPAGSPDGTVATSRWSEGTPLPGVPLPLVSTEGERIPSGISFKATHESPLQDGTGIPLPRVRPEVFHGTSSNINPNEATPTSGHQNDENSITGERVYAGEDDIIRRAEHSSLSQNDYTMDYNLILGRPVISGVDTRPTGRRVKTPSLPENIPVHNARSSHSVQSPGVVDRSVGVPLSQTFLGQLQAPVYYNADPEGALVFPHKNQLISNNTNTQFGDYTIVPDDQSEDVVVTSNPFMMQGNNAPFFLENHASEAETKLPVINPVRPGTTFPEIIHETTGVPLQLEKHIPDRLEPQTVSGSANARETSVLEPKNVEYNVDNYRIKLSLKGRQPKAIGYIFGEA